MTEADRPRFVWTPGDVVITQARAAARKPETLVHKAADDHEEPLKKVVLAAFAAGRNAVNRKQLQHALATGNKDLAASALAAAPLAVKRALLRGLHPVLHKVIIAGGHAGAALLEPRAAKRREQPLELGFRFDSTNPEAQKWARDHAAELAEDLSDTTRDDIAEALEYAFETGDMDGAEDDIIDAVGDEDRGALIAGHEAMKASAEGQRHAWSQAVDDGLLGNGMKREWIITGDDKVCPDCESLDGATAPVGGQYPDPGGDGPPLHPRCLPGFVTVEGSVIAATRMLYAGQVREIKTRKGRVLTVTENHPVVTDRGFVAARQIHEGDYLVSYDQRVVAGDVDSLRSIPLMPGSLNFLPQNDQHGPTTIEQVFGALKKVGHQISVRRFGQEFHGDALHGHGDIEVVFINSELLDSGESALSNNREGFDLELSNRSTESVHAGRSHSSVMSVGVGIAEPAAKVESPGTGCPLLLDTYNICFGPTSNLDAALLEIAKEFDPRDSSGPRQLKQRLPTTVSLDQIIELRQDDRVSLVNDSVGLLEAPEFHTALPESVLERAKRDPGLAHKIHERLPGFVAFDEVIEVRNVFFKGHVYDLQTVSGLIVAEGLLISNCRCTEGIIG